MGKVLVVVYSHTCTCRRFADMLGRAPVLSTAFTAREVKDGSCAERLRGAFVTRPAVWSAQSA